jgi:hypothetical protein
MSDSGSASGRFCSGRALLRAERAAAGRVVVQLMPLRDTLAALRTSPFEAVERSRYRVAAKAQSPVPSRPSVAERSD